MSYLPVSGLPGLYLHERIPFPGKTRGPYQTWTQNHSYRKFSVLQKQARKDLCNGYVFPLWLFIYYTYGVRKPSTAMVLEHLMNDDIQAKTHPRLGSLHVQSTQRCPLAQHVQNFSP